MSNIVSGLWVEGELSPFAQLTVASFLEHHQQFTLWTYGFPSNIPQEIDVRDAREILPEESVFRYSHGEAAGSLAGFSDVFRAKLLHDHGGWWVDMDVTLLRPIPQQLLDSPIVLRDHWSNPVVGNVMKFPAGHPATYVTYQLSEKAVRSENKEWNKPLRILSMAVCQMGLVPQYRHRIAHLDEFIDVLPFVRLPVDFPESWWAMHWCNEMWRRGNDQAHLAKGSSLQRLFDHYQIDASNLRKN
jgi:hypothetical protein